MPQREGPSEIRFEKLDNSGSVKISRDGTEIESTGNNTEHFRATVKVNGGKWYYEVKLITYGTIRIGWCTGSCNIKEEANALFGNDEHSWGYDGSSQRVFHGASGGQRYGEYWGNGDIIGCVLDLEAKSISYYRNGNDMGVAFSDVESNNGFFPVCSLGKKQKVAFNFGKQPFKYPLNEVFPDIHPLHIALTREQLTELEKLFEKYKGIGISLSQSGETNDVIKGQGFIQYGQDMGINDDKDPLLMVVAWKLGATDCKVWELSRQTFLTGWTLHECSNIPSMKKKAREWQEELKQPPKFKIFYFWVFDYLKEDRKILSMEEAITVWEMLEMNKRWPLMPRWLQHVQRYKAISRDTWRLLHNFMEQYPNDVGKYDSEGCWPSMIDEFVEELTKESKKK